TGIAFSPDGRRLVSASEDGTVKVWDVSLGQGPDTLNIDYATRRIAFDSTGSYLAGLDSVGGSVRVVDCFGGRRRLELEDRKWSAFSFGPEKQQVTVSDGLDVEIWDWSAGRRVRTIRGPKARVQHVVCGPDEKSLALAVGNTIST